jgi:hypothetical protein
MEDLAQDATGKAFRELAEDADAPETPAAIEAPRDRSLPQPAAMKPAAHPIDLASSVQLREDMRLFAGPNATKFIDVYDAKEGGRRPILPCWPGIFVPVPWFLYRKMYLLAASIFIPVVAGWLHVSEPLQIICLCLPSVLGGMGRWLYVAAARKKIVEIRARLPDDGEARAVIAMAGGVSVAGAVFAGLIGVLGVLSALVLVAQTAKLSF